jgi:alpha-tubulin suppressor-like RCC1 family protein
MSKVEKRPMKKEPSSHLARPVVQRRLSAIFFYIAILIGVMISLPIIVSPRWVTADLNPGLVPIVPQAQVSAGLSHSIFLDYDGQVYVWGDNTHHQLGIEMTDSKDEVTLLSYGKTPVQLPLPEKASRVSAGAYHTLVLGESGAVYAFGRNAYGQVGNGTVVNVEAPELIRGLPPIQMIATGAYHSLALGRDGSVWAWGHNTQNQAGAGTSEEVLGLDGEILALRRSRPVRVIQSGIRSIAAGSNFSLAITEQGDLLSFGENSKGQLGLGTTESTGVPTPVPGLGQVFAVAAGGDHVLALSEQTGSRQLFVWGDHALGQLGLGQLAGGKTFVTSPTLLDITGNRDPKDERLLSVFAGYASSAVVRDLSTARFLKPVSSNQLLVWGMNDQGQLGLGSAASLYEPRLVSGSFDGRWGDRFLPFEGIALGNRHLLVLSSNGVLAASGENSRGQLGLGTTESHASLQPVETADLIRPRWLGSQMFKMRWTSDGTLQLQWPDAQDNRFVAGYWIEITEAGQAPKLYPAEQRNQTEISGLNPAAALQISIFAYDEASETVNRQQLARLTGYSLPEGHEITDYFLSIDPVLAPKETIDHHWLPKKDRLWQAPEVPWSMDSMAKAPESESGSTVVMDAVSEIETGS